MMNISTKKVVKTFKIGQFVTTEYSENHKHIPRKITNIVKSKDFGSGFGITADGGDPCPCCGKTPAKPITKLIDGAWYLPLKEK